MPTKEEVFEALRQVEDPELGMDIVEPKTVSCFHQIRWSCAGGFGPVVAPQTQMRPAGRAESRERFQVASPTWSTTTWAPPPVASFTAATTSSVA